MELPRTMECCTQVWWLQRVSTRIMLSGTNGMSGPPRPRISRASGVEFQLKRVTGMESQHMRATKCALPRKAMGARSQLIVWGSPHQCVQIAGLPDPVGPRVLDFLGAYNLFSVYISPFGMRCPIPFPALYFKSIQHIRFHKFTTGVPSIPDSDDIQMRIWTYAFELLTHERDGFCMLLLSFSCWVVSDSTVDCSPPHSCPWDSPGKNNRVGCHFILQVIFPTQGSNSCLLCLLHWQVGSLPLTPPGKPKTYV